ncbi:hypothetical protein QBC39DRAFT_334203 [Podospora conica]|nr:hypothetical protein QBC39DRAFT_334203 [Schizothecium conicum]
MTGNYFRRLGALYRVILNKVEEKPIKKSGPYILLTTPIKKVAKPEPATPVIDDKVVKTPPAKYRVTKAGKVPEFKRRYYYFIIYKLTFTGSFIYYSPIIGTPKINVILLPPPSFNESLFSIFLPSIDPEVRGLSEIGVRGALLPDRLRKVYLTLSEFIKRAVLEIKLRIKLEIKLGIKLGIKNYNIGRAVDPLV